MICKKNHFTTWSSIITKRCFFIAEAGVNHNGNLDTAKKLIEVAAEAGADAVKFQTFYANKLVTKTASKASYQADLTGREQSQFSMLKSLELSEDNFLELGEFADQHNIEFMSTAFDGQSLEFLVSEVGVRRLKIPSGEITNGPFLLEHARKGLPLIMSTGMATIDEIHDALSVLAFGASNDQNCRAPTKRLLAQAYEHERSKDWWGDRITLLHCTSEYPAPLEEINLRALHSMSENFGLPCGYSDHSEGVEVSIAAAALGATVIEKHFTLDKTLPGPDHMASLDPKELALLVRGIHSVTIALGSDVKKVGVAEAKNISMVRRGLYASKDIYKSESFTSENVICLRPANGKSPMEFWQIMGQPALKNYRKGDPIE